MTEPANPFDMLIIGGGINGAGIACDAAGRGLKVLLCDKGDLGGATSSASSKLIHGGLRYLEHYEFGLVGKALRERDVMLKKAPHIVWPLEFVLPHRNQVRPAWLVRLGLYIYDALAMGTSLPRSRRIDLARHPAGRPLADTTEPAFTYSDCWVDDARLTILNAIAARDRGADVRPHTTVVSARRDGDVWQAVLKESDGGSTEVRARAVVNAAGPWVSEVAAGVVGSNTRRRIRLVKGSHIVVPRLYDGPHAYILQNADKRIVFVLPFHDDFSLIGTTDVSFAGDPATVAIDPAETRYLCDTVNGYFAKKIGPADAAWSYAGVRPLFDDDEGDPSKVTRDWALELDEAAGAPTLTVLGGKITTYRKLAEDAIARLAPRFDDLGPAWTATAPLPGGDMANADFESFLAGLCRRRSWLDPATARALARRHGTRAESLLGDARSMTDMGRAFGGGLYAREVDFLMREEWARDADAVLWRRTKCGLAMTEAERNAVAEAMAKGF